MAVIDEPKKQTAFTLRLEGKSFKEVAQEVKVSTVTLAKWENGWMDKQGHHHAGWKQELEKLWKEQEQDVLQWGLMVKQERLKTYDKLVKTAVSKIEEQFPDISLKSAGDVKSILSEVRELCKLIAIETGQYNPYGSNNATPPAGPKADIPMMEIEERYRRARIPVGNNQTKEINSDEQ